MVGMEQQQQGTQAQSLLHAYVDLRTTIYMLKYKLIGLLSSSFYVLMCDGQWMKLNMMPMTQVLK